MLDLTVGSMVTLISMPLSSHPLRFCLISCSSRSQSRYHSGLILFDLVSSSKFSSRSHSRYHSSDIPLAFVSSSLISSRTHSHPNLNSISMSSPLSSSTSISPPPYPPRSLICSAVILASSSISSSIYPHCLSRRMPLALIPASPLSSKTNPNKATQKNKNEETNRDSHRLTNLLNDSCPLPLIKSCKPLSSDSRREVRSCPGRGSAFTSPSLSPSFGLNLISSDVRD